MWKAIIVDDDPSVLRGMKKAIPWEKLGIECIGEASDGKAGFEVIMDMKPDIVLTDIYMPVMNGLEMMNALRENQYTGSIIILSGYSDFEYARTALRLKVQDYLSKPITIQTMEEALRRVTARLEEERIKQNDQEDMQQKINYYKSLISNTWLKSLMMGIEDQETAQNEQKTDYLQKQKHQVLVVKLDKENQAIEWDDLQENISCFFSAHTLTYLKNFEWIELDSLYSAILLSYDQQMDDESCQKTAQSIADKLLELVHTTGDSTCKIGMGRVKSDWEEIPVSTEESFCALSKIVFQSIVRYEDIPVSEQKEFISQKSAFRKPVQFYRELSDSIKHGRKDQAVRIVNDFILNEKERAYSLPSHLQTMCKELWIILTYSLYDEGINLEEIVDHHTAAYQIERIHLKEQFQHWILASIELILSRIQQEEKENIRHKQTVDYLIEYIDSHYHENLTLNQLAEKVFLSRNYLSQIFKKATGLSFNQYLNNVRMEKAKYLILEGNYLIYEIAEKVGYKNTPYFSSMFKKYTGVNPTDLLKQ